MNSRITYNGFVRSERPHRVMSSRYGEFCDEKSGPAIYCVLLCFRVSAAVRSCRSVSSLNAAQRSGDRIRESTAMSNVLRRYQKRRCRSLSVVAKWSDVDLCDRPCFPRGSGDRQPGHRGYWRILPALPCPSSMAGGTLNSSRWVRAKQGRYVRSELHGLSQLH